MHVYIEYDYGAFRVERSGDISEMGILALLGYREARNWALAPDNRETVLANLTSRGEAPLANYIEFRLFDTFCESVWGQMPPEDPEFMLGFCVGVHEAVKQLGSPSPA